MNRFMFSLCTLLAVAQGYCGAMESQQPMEIDSNQKVFPSLFELAADAYAKKWNPGETQNMTSLDSASNFIENISTDYKKVPLDLISTIEASVVTRIKSSFPIYSGSLNNMTEIYKDFFSAGACKNTSNKACDCSTNQEKTRTFSFDNNPEKFHYTLNYYGCSSRGDQEIIVPSLFCQKFNGLTHLTITNSEPRHGLKAVASR